MSIYTKKGQHGMPRGLSQPIQRNIGISILYKF